MSETKTNLVEALQPAAGGAEEAIGAGAGHWISEVFSGPLRVVFEPVNRLLTALDGELVALCSAMALFLMALAWVWFGLKKEYVNLDQPRATPLLDLRVWTALALLPYILIYLMFGVGRGGG